MLFTYLSQQALCQIEIRKLLMSFWRSSQPGVPVFLWLADLKSKDK